MAQLYGCRDADRTVGPWGQDGPWYGGAAIITPPRPGDGRPDGVWLKLIVALCRAVLLSPQAEACALAKQLLDLLGVKP